MRTVRATQTHGEAYVSCFESGSVIRSVPCHTHYFTRTTYQYEDEEWRVSEGEGGRDGGMVRGREEGKRNMNE